MSLEHNGYRVRCDEPGCERTAGGYSPTPGAARTYATAVGFKVEKYPSNGALCAEHKPKEKSA